MDWNHENEAVAVSASSDGTVCIWDISNASKLDSIVRPVSKAEFGAGGIYDIKWHKKHSNIFASTSTTGDLYLYTALTSDQTQD
jgi:WD40 repeat protein